MENEWTFDEYGNEEWCHDSFESKEDAITEGLKHCKGKTIVVGQLIGNGLNYRIENKEVIKSDYQNLIGEESQE